MNGNSVKRRLSQPKKDKNKGGENTQGSQHPSEFKNEQRYINVRNFTYMSVQL
jgi:hypothetical protein